MDVLRNIMRERAQAVAAAAATTPLEALIEQAAGRVHHSLRERLAVRGATSVIAEMKKASPSAGLLQPDYRPAERAALYEANGAAAISVLTEPNHFLGSADHLRAARAATRLPILRKDFLCDVYQVAEAAAWGADVILLIVAALDPGDLHVLYEAACRHGLEVLAEVHTTDELTRALELPGAIVGVNSRNLKTLKTDLAIARTLAKHIPADRLTVAESGIRDRAEIRDLQAHGYDGFLIGEVLMSASDPAGKLRSLLGS